MTRSLLLFFLMLLVSVSAMAQKRYQVSGVVVDKNMPVSGAGILLYNAGDTLKVMTDNLGKFLFKQVKVNQFTLKVKSLGFLVYSNTYTINSGESMVIAPIMLEADSTMLREVVIEGKIVPVKVMQDTIEYDARAYKTKEHDRVEEILKQLPGVEVDNEGNVKSMGKALTKIRVNGKDFFTGNVKEFISKLPADIISKIQIIDDYGDEAKITGIKSGEPRKLLNLVTKPNKNGGTFGTAEASVGSNEQFNTGVNGSLWNDDKQAGAEAHFNRQNNGAGHASDRSAMLQYNNKIVKDITFGLDYNYQGNNADSKVQSFSETLNAQGKLNTDNTSQSFSGGEGHNFAARIYKQSKTAMLHVGATAALPTNHSNDDSRSLLTGIITQGLATKRNMTGSSPDLTFNGMYAGKVNKSILSVNVSANNGLSKSKENIYDEIRYFDQIGNKAGEDSVLNRLLDNRNNNKNLRANVTFGYNFPKSEKDSLATRTLSANYGLSVNRTDNSLQTSVQQPLSEMMTLVDSLSLAYQTSFMTNSFGLSYQFRDESLFYSFGISPRLNVLKGNYEGRSERVHTENLSLAPELNLMYTFKPGRMVTFRASQQVNPPGFMQLQPVRDTRNLQNQVIGNPNLKPSENISTNLNLTETKTNGFAMQLGMNANFLRNQVVGNTVFLIDTLNSLKQQTTYENANGGFNYSGFWSFSRSFFKNAYAVELSGNAGYNKSVFFSEGIKGYTDGLNLAQNLRMRMNEKWVSLNANVGYSLSNNSYSVGALNLNTIQRWMFSGDGLIRFKKDLNAGFQVSKMISSGYALTNTNPLLINLNVEQLLFKQQQGSIRLSAFDLLNQGNNLERVISGNTITDTRINQVTRYFLMTLSMKLEQFGG